MAVTFAGVPLLSPTPEQVSWLEANLSPRDYSPFLQHPYWLATVPPQVTWAALSEARPIKLNTLWWPWGASRWAIAHFVISENQKALIEAAVPPPKGSASLVMSWQQLNDGKTVDSLTATMYYLPPRPLSQITGFNGSYLLTLVDQRWWWNTEMSTGTFSVTNGTTTWAQCYSTLATALGITIAVDAIPSAYQKPSAVLNRNFEYVPPLLDLVAANVGQRIVRSFSGAVSAKNHANSQTQAAKNQSLVSARSKEAGGQMLVAEMQLQTPSKIQVAFPEYIGNTPTGLYHGVTAGTSNAGNGFTKVYRHSTAATVTSTGGTPTNLSSLQTLANQLASDTFGWAASNYDLKFAGLLNWTPEAWTDNVEWTHGIGRSPVDAHLQGPGNVSGWVLEGSTRVQSGLFDWGGSLPCCAMDAWSAEILVEPVATAYLLGGSGGSDSWSAEILVEPVATAYLTLPVPLTVPYGGTGQETLSSGYALLGNGTSPISQVAPGTSGNVLTSNGSTWVSSPNVSGGSGRLLGRTEIVATGAFTFTTSASTNTLIIELQAAGGGGAAAAATGAGQLACGGGGASGEYRNLKIAVSPSTGYTGSVGAGGTKGDHTATGNGGNGGDTSITIGGNTYTAKGGGGAGAASASGTAAFTSGGVPNTGSGAVDFIATGQEGDQGIQISSTIGQSGSGGNSAMFGGGGRGKGAIPANAGTINTGGGGSGGFNPASQGTGRDGAAGGDGIAIIWEYS